MKTAIQSPASNLKRRHAFVILGMHRSGTSALAGTLNLLGASAPKTLIPASEANPKGFWESLPIMQLNDELLSSAGLFWDDWQKFDLRKLDPKTAARYCEQMQDLIRDQFENEPLFVLKDPRICRFFPLVEEVLVKMNVDTTVFIAFRNPLEVAHSLSFRLQFPFSKTLLMWQRHMLDAEFYSRGVPRFFIPYERFLDDWFKYLSPAAHTAGIKWPALYGDSTEPVQEFLSAELRNRRFTIEDLKSHPEISSWILDTYRAFIALSEGHDMEKSTVALDTLRVRFDEACHHFSNGTISQDSATQLDRADIEDMKMRMNQATTQNASRMHDLSKRISTLEQDVAALEADRDQYQRKSTFLEKELSELKTSVAPYRRLMSALSFIRSFISRSKNT